MFDIKLIPTLKYEWVNPEFTPATMLAYFHCCLIFMALGLQLKLSSGKDSHHGNTSLHFPGAGFDISTKELPDSIDPNYLVDLIKQSLNVHFDVVYEEESTHIHVEWQPRGNLIYASHGE